MNDVLQFYPLTLSTDSSTIPSFLFKLPKYFVLFSFEEYYKWFLTKLNLIGKNYKKKARNHSWGHSFHIWFFFFFGNYKEPMNNLKTAIWAFWALKTYLFKILPHISFLILFITVQGPNIESHASYLWLEIIASLT